MIRGLYDAGAALNLASLHQELLAENLANATTPGYRRHGISFEQTLETPRVGDVTNHVYFTDFNAGALQQTGNPFDVAIAGDAFFVVEGPNGPVYTRNGAFEIDAEGNLRTRSGLRVMGQGGALTIPPEAGAVTINQEGAVLAGGAEVGRLKLARFENPRLLQRVGNTLFRADGALDPEPGSFRVEQGFVEASNVDAVQEMIAMMIGMRQYEAAEKALRAMSESSALHTRPQA